MLVLTIVIHICSTRKLCSRKLGLWSVLGTLWLCKVDGIFAVSKLMKVRVYFEWPRDSYMNAWNDLVFSQFYCFFFSFFLLILYIYKKRAVTCRDTYCLHLEGIFTSMREINFISLVYCIFLYKVWASLSWLFHGRFCRNWT